MDYVGTGRVIRELGAGVAKDAFNVYIQPNAAAGGSKVKEILLLPYNKVITPILTQLKEKIRGKPLSLTIDGEELNFLLPEKYTRLGLGNEFREILDQHAELSRVYRFMEAGRLHQIKRKEIPSDSPERRLFIDTDMNIYEIKDGDDVLLKLFGNGDFLDVPEEVPIRKMVGSGLISAKDFLKRQHDTVDNRNDFEPYTNIFPAGSSTKSKEKVYNYLDELSNQSLTENGLEKMEILDPSRYNSLIRRLRQERDWEKSTNMGLRLETDINFLKILSNRDLSEIAKSLFRQYKNGGKLNCDDIYKSLNRNFRQVRPNRQIESNPFLDSADKRLSLAIEAGPTFRNILLERGKNLAIDAGVGAAASTMHIWAPAVATAGSALLTFSAWLLNKLISRSGNPENFSERALNEITNFSQQVSAAVIELQKRNSNNAQLIESSNQINDYIREAVNQAIDEYKKSQVNSVKQFERVTERIFDKLGSKEENITELPFIEDQIHTLDPPPSPYKFPSKENKQSIMNYPARVPIAFNFEGTADDLVNNVIMSGRPTAAYEELVWLKDTYTRNNLKSPKVLNIISAVNKLSPLFEARSDLFSELRSFNPFSLRPIDSFKGLGVIDKIPPPPKRSTIPNLPKPPLATTKINPARVSGTFENRILSQGDVNEEEANMIGANIRKMIAKDTRLNYNGPKHLEGEAVVERLQRLQYEPDEPEPSKGNFEAFKKGYGDVRSNIRGGLSRGFEQVWDFLRDNKEKIGIGALGLGAAALAGYGIKKGIDYLRHRKRRKNEKNKKESTKQNTQNNKKPVKRRRF